jgi:hypothetical protein
MSGFYSFRVYSPCELALKEQLVMLTEGMNTFNCHVDDIGLFVSKLEAEGVRIDQANHLDAPEPEDDPEIPLLPELL